MAGYVFFGLLLLLSPAFGVENLLNIINHLHNTYGANNQYALGISVPEHYCNQVAPLDQNFLSQDDGKGVKNAMASMERVYIGTQLIGAKTLSSIRKTSALRINPLKIFHMLTGLGKRVQNLKKALKEAIHAEYLLLSATNPSHMQNLLNKPNGNCTVFFIMNSPCVDRCLTPARINSIIPGLETFRNYNGPKAFVFRQVYKLNNPKEWESKLLEVDQRIPVYRCTTTKCVRCITSDGVVDPKCTAE